MYHDCNADFEKIRKRIEEEKNKCKKCYIQGPTGPKGEIGPTGPKGENGFSTVDVGETKTGEANTNAMVENVGTNKNAILNFTIPRGEAGDKIIIGKTETLDANARARVEDTYAENVHTLDFYIPQGFDGVNGEIGPKGEQGDPGISEKIEVINTKTVDSGQLAEVKDEFTDNTHYLTFLIPKGDKGDTGPQGSVGTAILDSYASLYEDNGNSYMLVANTPNQVELSKNSQIKNMDISFTNTVKVLNAGIYKIDYFFSSVASAQSDISIELRKENITINGTKITKKVNNQEYVWFNGSIIVSLNKDEKIDLAVSSTTNVILTPDEDTVSYLNIIKIG